MFWCLQLSGGLIVSVDVSSQRTNIIKLIIHCSRFGEASDGTLTTVYWEEHHSSVTLKREMKSILIELPPFPAQSPLMTIIISPLFIMSHTPPLTRALISSFSVWRRKFCVALKCFFHNVTSWLAARGGCDKWRKNTEYEYQPVSVLSLSLFTQSQNHFYSRFKSQSITKLKNTSGETQFYKNNTAGFIFFSPSVLLCF